MYTLVWHLYKLVGRHAHPLKLTEACQALCQMQQALHNIGARTAKQLTDWARRMRTRADSGSTTEKQLLEELGFLGRTLRDDHTSRSGSAPPYTVEDACAGGLPPAWACGEELVDDDNFDVLATAAFAVDSSSDGASRRIPHLPPNAAPKPGPDTAPHYADAGRGMEPAAGLAPGLAWPPRLATAAEGELARGGGVGGNYRAPDLPMGTGGVAAAHGGNVGVHGGGAHREPAEAGADTVTYMQPELREDKPPTGRPPHHMPPQPRSLHSYVEMRGAAARPLYSAPHMPLPGDDVAHMAPRPSPPMPPQPPPGPMGGVSHLLPPSMAPASAPPPPPHPAPAYSTTYPPSSSFAAFTPSAQVQHAQYMSLYAQHPRSYLSYAPGPHPGVHPGPHPGVHSIGHPALSSPPRALPPPVSQPRGVPPAPPHPLPTHHRLLSAPPRMPPHMPPPGAAARPGHQPAPPPQHPPACHWTAVSWNPRQTSRPGKVSLPGTSLPGSSLGPGSAIGSPLPHSSTTHPSGPKDGFGSTGQLIGDEMMATAAAAFDAARAAGPIHDAGRSATSGSVLGPAALSSSFATSAGHKLPHPGPSGHGANGALTPPRAIGKPAYVPARADKKASQEGGAGGTSDGSRPGGAAAPSSAQQKPAGGAQPKPAGKPVKMTELLKSVSSRLLEKGHAHKSETIAATGARYRAGEMTYQQAMTTMTEVVGRELLVQEVCRLSQIANSLPQQQAESHAAPAAQASAPPASVPPPGAAASAPPSSSTASEEAAAAPNTAEVELAIA